MLFRFLILVLFISCSTDKYNWFIGTVNEALVLIESNPEKLILLDFYSDGWGGCVRLDAETLSDSRVVQFSNSNFISLKLKPWENDEHAKIFNQYMGQSIPLIIFLNNKGEEVDRILGFYKADEYLKMITDIYNGIDTYLSLKSQYQSDNKNLSVLSKLSTKCKLNPEPDFCEEVYSNIATTRDGFKDNILFNADWFFAKNKLEEDEPNLMIKLIENHGKSSYSSDAYLAIINYYKLKNNPTIEADMFKKFTDIFNDNPSILNQYAWRMAELKINLDDALNKSDKAIELSFDNPSLQIYIIDTKSEILWMLGRIDEAINTINLAIDINPSDEYLIEQREKFLNSKK